MGIEQGTFSDSGPQEHIPPRYEQLGIEELNYGDSLEFVSALEIEDAKKQLFYETIMEKDARIELRLDEEGTLQEYRLRLPGEKGDVIYFENMRAFDRLRPPQRKRDLRGH